MAYLVFGREVGSNGTPHLQGYVSFSKRRSLSYVRKKFGKRCHCEIARGSPQQASDYCKKEGDFEEFGTLPRGRGQRSDIESAIKSIREGCSRSDLITNHPGVYARAFRMLNEALSLYSSPRSWMPVTKVYWGETGLGKTKRAFEEATADGSTPYVHSGGMWFDGYDGERGVIFDDFGGSEFKLTYLLKLLDRYPMRVAVKGSFVNWIPREIWITSNYAPQEWFPNAKPEHVKALRRRISEVVHFRSLVQFEE